MRKLLFLIIINALCVGSLHAEKIYKHAPFSLRASTSDTIVVEYDLSTNRGLRCMSDNKHIDASFMYKGREKTARLPILLQNSRVPMIVGEELADTNGTITMTVETTQPVDWSVIEIQCRYIQ